MQQTLQELLTEVERSLATVNGLISDRPDRKYSITAFII